MAVIGADHEAVFAGIFQYVRQIVIGLAGNEQLTAIAQHIGIGRFAEKFRQAQVNVVDYVRNPLRGDFYGADAEMRECSGMPRMIIA